MKNFETTGFMRLLGKNTVIRSMIPLGFQAGAPAIRTENGRVFVIVPYARFKTTGDIDNTLVYPILYTATFEALQPAEPPENFAKAAKPGKEIFPGKLVAFNTLSYMPECGNMDFDKPVGTFRHEAVKKYSKEEYIAQIQKMYAAYDKVIHAYFAGQEPEISDKMQMKTLLNELIVPEQKNMYRFVDAAFYDLYLA